METNQDIYQLDINSEELYHYGRKGMKWGQHIFGKIKAAKTAKKRREAAAKARATKEAKAQRARDVEAGRIKPKDMTSEELRRSIEKRQLEKQYKQLDMETRTSAGMAFAKTVGNKVLAPAAIAAGEQFLRKALTQAGDDLLKKTIKPDDLAVLRTTAEKMRLQNEIKKLKNPTESLEEAVKRLENEKKYKDLTADYNDLERENRSHNARQKYDENHKSTSDSDSKKTAEKSSKTEEKTGKQESSKSNEGPYTGTVEWTTSGKKAKSESGKSWTKANADIIDAVWRDVTDSNSSSSTEIVVSGRNYIAGLLEDKSK